jgi:hypothetical protein
MTAETQLKVARSLTIAGLLLGAVTTTTNLFPDKWTIWIALAASLCTGLGAIAKRWAGHIAYTILGAGFTACGMVGPALASIHPKVANGFMLAGVLILMLGKTAFNFDPSKTTDEAKDQN